MWHVLRHALILRSGLGLALWFVAAAPVNAQAIDPVEDLRETLPMRLDDIASLNDPADPAAVVVLQFREQLLQKKVDALKTIPQLRRALALQEWNLDPGRVLSDKLRRLDTDMRKQIGTRLVALIRDVVKSGDANSKLAVANVIAEMGPTVRALDPLDPSGFARSLTPEVIQLTQETDLAVRQEALRALGNINARIALVMPVFVNVLKKDTLGPRRLAADALGQLVRVVAHLQKRGGGENGVAATRAEVVETAQSVIDQSVLKLNDEDAQVRALCLIAFQTASQALADQILEPFNKRDFPPEGRKLSLDERKQILSRQDLARKEMLDLIPGLQAIRTHAPTLVNSLRDPSALVKLSAVRALESSANARLRLRRRILSVPNVQDDVDELNKVVALFLEKNDPLAPLLAKGLDAETALLRDPDTRLRRATLDFLELLEGAAVPAIPQLISSLSDPDRFVRWGAVRTFGLFPPEKYVAEVPQIARLLSDSDLNVRISAAQTLESMGGLAKDAAPALALAVSEGDTDARIPAMYALQRLPPAASQVAVPQLTDILRNSDPRLRRSAAETLGRLGPVASSAIPALRRALGDEDAEVRMQASDAILNITSEKK